MKYVNFRNDKISKYVLGTVQFGLKYGIANQVGQLSQKAVDEIVKVSSNYLNTYDTAQAYGTSEFVLGKALKKITSDKQVISKLSTELFIDNTEKHIKESLNNLQSDSLYALLLHDSRLLQDWNINLHMKVKNLKEKGLMQYFGVSIYTSEEFQLAVENPDIDMIQIPFNLFDQRAIHKRWFDKAKDKNKFLFVRSVFLQGLLLMDVNDIPDKLNSTKKYILKLDKICSLYNLKRIELVIGFVESCAKNASILFGCDSMQQAKENFELFSSTKTLSQNMLSELFEEFSSIDETIYNPAKWS